MDSRRAPLSQRGFPLLAYGLPLAFLALFFLFPLATIVERGLRSADGQSALDVLTDPLTRDVLWFTVWLAAASTVRFLFV